MPLSAAAEESQYVLAQSNEFVMAHKTLRRFRDLSGGQLPSSLSAPNLLPAKFRTF